MEKAHIDYLTPELLRSEEEIWINPVGGLGDVLMMSTAMKCSFDAYGKQFHMARRTRYTEFFVNHPAVKAIGNPPMGSYVVCNDYWMREEFLNPENKALAIVKKIFGVEDDQDDSLYVAPAAFEKDDATLLLNTIPWREKNVVIAFTSDSPRKMMHPIKWHIIVEQLMAQQVFVAQVGQMGDLPIHGAYALMGCTTPYQVMEVLRKSDLVITLDNFIMHAAKAVNTPVISLFGPTEASRYAYRDHVCLQAPVERCELYHECLGPHVSHNYATPCPCGPDRHCMNQIDERRIIDIAISILNK